MADERATCLGCVPLRRRHRGSKTSPSLSSPAPTTNTLTLLLLGLDNAGKSSLSLRLSGDAASPPPQASWGFSTTSMQYGLNELRLHDVGGGERIRGIWSDYYADAFGLMFVVDGSDEGRRAEVVGCWSGVVWDERMKDKPTVISVNKSDQGGSIDTVIEWLGLQSEPWQSHGKGRVLNNSLFIIPCNASTGKKVDPNIAAALDWLIITVTRDRGALRRRVGRDTAAQQRRWDDERELQRQRVQKWREADEAAAAAAAPAPPTQPQPASADTTPTPRSTSRPSSGRSWRKRGQGNKVHPGGGAEGDPMDGRVPIEIDPARGVAEVEFSHTGKVKGDGAGRTRMPGVVAAEGDVEVLFQAQEEEKQEEEDMLNVAREDVEIGTGEVGSDNEGRMVEPVVEEDAGVATAVAAALALGKASLETLGKRKMLPPLEVITTSAGGSRPGTSGLPKVGSLTALDSAVEIGERPQPVAKIVPRAMFSRALVIGLLLTPAVLAKTYFKETFDCECLHRWPRPHLATDHFIAAETWRDRWIHSESEHSGLSAYNYNRAIGLEHGWSPDSPEAYGPVSYGDFNVSTGKIYAVDAKVAARGLMATEDGRHFAISAPMDEEFDNEGKDLVLQFSVKFEQSL
ncbi:ADP-ribosylation factor-like protein 13B, partial [Irineochytrium annulatum]